MKLAAYLLCLSCASLVSGQLPIGKRNYKCGGVKSGVSGFIGSEGFPGLYPANSKCTWKITVLPHHVPRLKSEQEAWFLFSAKAAFDQLGGNITANTRKSADAGNSSNTHKMLVERSMPGSIYREKHIQRVLAQNVDCASSCRCLACCVLYVQVPKGRVVALNFRILDLERDTLCRYDYVDVYDGHVNGQRLGRFCGTSKPGAIISSGNKMLVQMVTDANTAGNGFVAMYSATRPNQRNDQFCGGRLEKSPGSFKTPNWPDYDYPAGVSCSWHIVAPKNQIIELKFEKFDVERDNYCRYDYVSVYNGGENNDAKRIGKFCGDSPPAPVLSQENEIVVQFLSDLSVTADGFLAHYKFRSKKFLSTAAPVTTPTITTMKPTVPPCQLKCRRSGTMGSNYCNSDFVLTGTVITAVTRNGSIHATISIINIYKEGTLAIQQAGKNMSVKIIAVCKKCPIIKRGLNYIFMGQVDETGRGRVLPNSFVVPYKSKNQRFLNNLKNRRC